METSKIRRIKTKDGKFLMLPKNDYAFKRIFGSESNKDLLIALLNATINLDNDEIEGIELVDRELEGDYYDDKKGILDVRCKTKVGTQINVEMQLINNRNMDKRVLFYWSKMYTSQMRTGERYNRLKKTITISILDFEYLAEIEKMHSVFHIIEESSKKKLTDIFEMHFIEIPKLYKKYAENESGELKDWIEFIGSEDEEVLKMLAEKNEKIKRAYTVLNIISQDEIDRREYEAREMQLHDEVSRLEDAKEEGKAEGKEEDALNFLKLGVNDTIVAQGTGLSLEKVIELKNKLMSITGSTPR